MVNAYRKIYRGFRQMFSWLLYAPLYSFYIYTQYREENTSMEYDSTKFLE